MKVRVTDLQIRHWRRQGYSLEQIASACGMTTSQMSRRLRRMYSMDQTRHPDPGPEEISAACEEIQRDWSLAQRKSAYVGGGRQWTPAVVPASLLGLVLD